MTHTTDEELDALQEGLSKLGGHGFPNWADDAVRAITALRAQLGEVQAERDNANKIMDDWTTLHRVIADIRDASGLGSRPMLSELASKIGKRIADANARADTNEALYVKALGRSNEQEDRADRAEAERAAQIDADAGMIERIVAEARQEVGNIKLSKVDAAVVEMLSGIVKAIRAQPHDRSALDRKLAEAREKALRDLKSALQSTCIRNDTIYEIINSCYNPETK